MLLPYSLSTIYLFIVISIVSSFSPDLSSFDAYGLKLAANDVFLVESISSNSGFFLRLAPFTYSLSCTLAYNDSSQYVYAVAVNRQATTNDSIRFVFVGVNTNTDVPFIGSLTYTGISGNAYIATLTQTRKIKFPCDGWQNKNYHMHQLEQFVSNESDENINNDFFVVTVAPTGQFAYAFAKNFLIIYNLDADTISIQMGNVTWPDPSFLPHAVDISPNMVIVVLGYIGEFNIQYTPCAYLLTVSNSSFSVLDTWSYTPPTNTSWQASLTNWDADQYSPKYDMSVSMNDDKDQVLLGIQIVNTIVLLNINRTTNNFSLPSQTSPTGKSIGMGKTVGWLDTDLAVVLVNTYSFSYVWSSSQIFVYNVSDPNSFVVLAILPNIQQTLVTSFGPELLSLVVTSNGTMIMLDVDGDYYIILPSPAGSFSDSSSRSSSSATPCMGGTFSSELSILPCSLCLSGTTTAGLTGQSSCKSCGDGTFCPLGAAAGNINLSSELLANIQQVYAYPQSPQSTRFDNILIQNMLVIHSASSSHCLLVSPLFWAIIVISLGVAIWLLLLLSKYCITQPRGQQTRRYIKKFFKKIDLIGEGEFVLGGLFSFAIIVLVSFSYSFSNAYFQQYPIEQMKGPSSFACDPTLSNAQFSAGLMSLAIPPTDVEVPIFKLLDEQSFTLYIDFVNTLFKCTDVSAIQIKDTNLNMMISSCINNDNTLSISLQLPSHGMSMQITLADTNTIGGLRMRLEGPGVDEENETLEATYTLVDLAFAQVFSVSGRLLTQQPSCALQLTKVINYTYPLEEGEETQFNAIWLPSFSANLDQMFVDESEYIRATSLNTVLSIVISETPYFVLNVQKPITDKDELVFSNLLFTIVCLEIFGLGFLLFKLIIFPLLRHIRDYFCPPKPKDESEKKIAEFSDILTHRL